MRARLRRSRPTRPAPGDRPATPCPTDTASLETLEPRIVLSAFDWTPEEVLMAELVNRARMDPIAEGQRLGLVLTEGLTPAPLARLQPQEPLALNRALTLAARAHNADMAARGFFAHDNPDGDSPSDRAQAAGYASGAGENIAAGQNDVFESHRGWLDSLGHRLNVLSLHDNFSDRFHYNELGTAALGPRLPDSPYQSYFGQLFGAGSGDPYILGVVIDDTDGDDFYDIGEGAAGVRVEITDRNSDELIASATTTSAGNYQLRVPARGAYTVTFVNPATGLVRAIDVNVDRDNVKVDQELREILAREDVDASVHADAAANPAYGPDGSLAVAALNQRGDIIVARKAPGGDWIADNLTRRTDAARAFGDVVTWYDNKDARLYAAAPTAEGLTLFTLSGQTWTARNLAEETATGVVLPDLTVFTGRDGLVRIAAVTPDASLLLYEQTGQAADLGFAWRATDLSTDHIEANGQPTPDFRGPLISYVTPWGGMNIAGLDRDGAIQAVWWAPGLSHWRASNLSDITGAPALSGGLTVNQTSWNGVNLVGIDAAGRVLTTWWVPSFGSQWRTNDLSANAGGGPALVSTSATSFTTTWDGINIAGLDDQGRVVVYWWAPGLTRWAVTPLTDTIPDAPDARGQLRGAASITGEISLVGAADNADLMRLHWSPGAQWTAERIADRV